MLVLCLPLEMEEMVSSVSFDSLGFIGAKNGYKDTVV